MQNNKIKKTCFFSLLLAILSHQLYSQDLKAHITLADSLFAQQHFTGALHIYEQIFAQSKQSSQSMLLKMAYIEEGEANYTKALYYLSLYYMQRPNLQVVNKMKDLAALYNLQGYEFKDVDFFMILYQRYYSYFAIVLLSICFIWLVSLIARKMRKEYLPARHLVGCILFMIIIFMFLNIKKTSQMAIIAEDNVYLMNAPSAGATLVSIMEKGHRLEIMGSQDVWIQVLWNGQSAFIRKQNVLVIQ
jgi:tetratricopeptide (TPR) repeat protein